MKGGTVITPETRLGDAAERAAEILAHAIKQGWTPHDVRNKPRLPRPFFRSPQTHAALYAAFHELDQELAGWAYRMGPE